MEHIAPIISSIASLLWVVFAFIVLFTFRTQAVDIFSRIKKGKFLGQKLELGDRLRELEVSAAAVNEEIEDLSENSKKPANIIDTENLDIRIKYILEQASVSPKISLMILQGEIEKDLQQALAMRGMLGSQKNFSAHRAFSELEVYGLPPSLAGSVKLFYDVRNRIVHAREAKDNDIVQAIDSGITILKAINSLPTETNFVYNAEIDIYKDSNLTEIHSVGKGLILETFSPGGAIRTLRIYPTTKQHFQKEKKVAWEWNMEQSWGQAWYRCPESGEIKSAWLSSAEFIGRNIDEI